MRDPPRTRNLPARSREPTATCRARAARRSHDGAAHRGVEPLRALGLVGVIWGVGGIIVFVAVSLYRIVPLGFSAYEYEFRPGHWFLLWTWVPFMIWSEGYRGFHRSFSPMVAARAKHLADHPRPVHVLLAPVYCMGLIHATKRRLIASTVLVAGIAALVLLVRLLPQPWRGIIDLGVVVGLSIGLASMAIWTFRAFSGDGIDVSPDVPDSTAG